MRWHVYRLHVRNAGQLDLSIAEHLLLRKRVNRLGKVTVVMRELRLLLMLALAVNRVELRLRELSGRWGATYRVHIHRCPLLVTLWAKLS